MKLPQEGKRGQWLKWGGKFNTAGGENGKKKSRLGAQ